MKALFHHAYDVLCENGTYRPTRFTETQLDALDALTTMLKNYARCSAGVSLLCRTDADEVSFAYHYERLHTQIGGFDVYENGVLHANIALPANSCDGVFTYQKETPGEITLEIVLPNNAEMTLWDLSFGDWKPIPKKEKLILWYGDSNAQSAYIPTPSLNFVRMTSSLLDMDYINRGVGSLFFDETVLDPTDRVKPDKLVVQFGSNDLVKHDGGKVVITNGVAEYWDADAMPMLIEKARIYLKKLKEIYPGVPVYVVSIFHKVTQMPENWILNRPGYCAGLEEVAKELGCTFVDGWPMVPHLAAAHAFDGKHLSALGNAYVAHSLTNAMK